MAEPLVDTRLTYQELCRLPADGHRYELIEGKPYMMTPSPNFGHQDTLLRLALAVHQAIQDDSVVAVAPLDVVFDETTALQPDLVLIREENRGIVQDVIRGVPDLGAEVLSTSTQGLDRGLKREIYARYGVGEYWIVDPLQRQVEIHRLAQGSSAYRLVETCRQRDSLMTPLLPHLDLDVAELVA